MINYIDRMADSLVDVLKYSQTEVEWPEPADLKPNDGVKPEWFYPAIENAEYSEISSILQYTQQEALFDEIGELMLGIALVEMKHFASVRDAIVALGGKLPQPFDNKNIKLGTNASEALILAAQAEIETIKFYKSIKTYLIETTDSVNITRQLLTKLIADETLHLKMINDRLKNIIGDEKEYNDIIKNKLPQINLYFS
ncbi:ferritin-like domain-containing protein [Coprobacter tertius]|uniref:Ferritin/DPS domain-containing protein n=1 Tax=Coprobacter tertius TaxID=2944915 RepID=A0ABT1MDE8_9BACT|nr:ferritin-like domain-containing protein [Coprobacter tertius]MCP9610657.1 hypothetical protein [Coprobacter tertius]